LASTLAEDTPALLLCGTRLVDGLAAQVQVQAGATVARVKPVASRGQVVRGDELLTACQVVLALGTPAATRAVLRREPGLG